MKRLKFTLHTIPSSDVSTRHQQTWNSKSADCSDISENGKERLAMIDNTLRSEGRPYLILLQGPKNNKFVEVRIR